MFVSLTPIEKRKIVVDDVIKRLRPQLARVPGATLYLQASQDLRVGGRFSNAQYQFTMRGDNLQDLNNFAPKMLKELRTIPVIADVSSDQQNRGLQSLVQYDRNTAARFGISPQLIDNTLYDAFGQRQVSTMYTALNQYHVVMEAAPQYWQNPETPERDLCEVTRRRGGSLERARQLCADHRPAVGEPPRPRPGGDDLFQSATGRGAGRCRERHSERGRQGRPAAHHPDRFCRHGASVPGYSERVKYLILAALAAVYIVLGILYESYVHPVTILSTLPSAGVGALLALMITQTDLSIIAIIGIILLIGIVKKNAIMMIDFALNAERIEGKNSRDSIFEACMLRFRPIMMTTMAAVLGALPLALGSGTGSELRRPLGITIIGGLMVSQLLTLYTTPVVYLYFDRLQHWWYRVRHKEPAPLLSEI